MGRHRRRLLTRSEDKPSEEPRQPIYAQVLGLRHIAPGGMLCFLFFEGSIALAVILGLTGLVSWWGVAAIPATVAIVVKLNDIVAGWIAKKPST
jgi:hypothetical protein